MSLKEKLFGRLLLISDEIVRQFVKPSKEQSMVGNLFVLPNRKVGRALIACARLVSFKFFFQCKAFWYSFCCLVSNVLCSLRAERCFLGQEQLLKDSF